MFADSYNAPYDIGDMSLAAEGHSLILRRVNSKQPLLEVGLQPRPCTTSGTAYHYIKSPNIPFLPRSKGLAEGVPKLRSIKRACSPHLVSQRVYLEILAELCQQCMYASSAGAHRIQRCHDQCGTSLDRSVFGVLVRRLLHRRNPVPTSQLLEYPMPTTTTCAPLQLPPNICPAFVCWASFCLKPISFKSFPTLLEASTKT